MVEREYIFRFLRDLRNNNSKEWMDENRDRYQTAKERWLADIQDILNRIVKYDKAFGDIDPKKTITRINNNRRFHPDKPIYKSFFSCTPTATKDGSAFHISIGPDQSFVGGGVYHPDKETLEKVRAAFDYNGDEFKKLISSKKLRFFCQ